MRGKGKSSGLPLAPGIYRVIKPKISVHSEHDILNEVVLRALQEKILKVVETEGLEELDPDDDHEDLENEPFNLDFQGSELTLEEEGLPKKSLTCTDSRFHNCTI